MHLGFLDQTGDNAHKQLLDRIKKDYEVFIDNHRAYAKLVKQRGIPDRIFVNKGLTIFAELKTKGKKPRESQVERIKEMRRHGAIVFVIDTLDDAKKLIKMLIAGKLDDDFQMKQESSDDLYDGYNYDY